MKPKTQTGLTTISAIKGPDTLTPAFTAKIELLEEGIRSKASIIASLGEIKHFLKIPYYQSPGISLVQYKFMGYADNKHPFIIHDYHYHFKLEDNHSIEWIIRARSKTIAMQIKKLLNYKLTKLRLLKNHTKKVNHEQST